MKRAFICILLICTCIHSSGQVRAASLAEAAALLSGAGSEEGLDEEALEYYARLAASPLNLNRTSAARLVESGLFSPYQAASITDYRERNGDVLSFAELAAVNGFDSRTADALRYFITLNGTGGIPENRKRWRGEQMLRISRRDEDDYTACRVTIRKESRAEFLWATRGTYADPSMPPGTFSMAAYSGNGGKLIAGDFNARLGQGLLLWSGFSTGGFPTADAFVRRAGGFSSTGSFSPTLRGLAMEYPRGGWRLRAAIAFPGQFLPVLSVSRTMRSAEAGLHFLNDPVRGPAVSSDWKIMAGSILLFGEGAVSTGNENKTVFAFTGGLQIFPAYRAQAIVSARYYPPGYDGSRSGAVRTGSKVSDEKGLATGLQWKWLGATLDAMSQEVREKRQIKSVVRASPDFSVADWLFTPYLQWTWRRTESRGKESARDELRTDLRLQHGPLLATVRGNIVFGKGRGTLFYFEPGFKGGKDSARVALSVFARGSIFRIANWDDRIYAWGRDVPGTFTVPAYYGHGHELALYCGAGMKCGRMRHSLWLRASFLRYEKGQNRMPHDEIRLQYSLRWQEGPSPSLSRGSP